MVYAGAAHAVSLEVLETGPLGRVAGLFVEDDGRLSPDAALALQQEGRFRPGVDAVPKFGIGARPVWLHLSVDNPATAVQVRQLVIGVAWLDKVDVYLMREGRVVAAQAAGDGERGRQHPLGGVGYVLDLAFEPGTTDLLLRVETPDPLVLPVELRTPAAHAEALRWSDHRYGLLYGYLLALIAYNAMLYAGLRERIHLDYAFYLAVFVLTNVAYSGYGYALLWPEAPGLQRYIILVLMLVFGCVALRFASRFLELKRRAPQQRRTVQWLCRGLLALLALTVIVEAQAAAAMLAFIGVLVISAVMVWLGLSGVMRGQIAARYFLAGALAAMIGAVISALGVWHGLPYSTAVLQAAELGVAMEGTLLALALAYRMRRLRQERVLAEELARIDPLTGLLNRRAFMEQATPHWSTAVRNLRPLSVMLIDLDHFKQINDRYGHAAGDRVLVEVGAVLMELCRRGDLCARWGGEEFILLLPETGVEQATRLAERLRQRITALVVQEAGVRIPLSASMGIAERDGQFDLETVIRMADGWLYHAKAAGRGRVCAPLALGFETGT